MNFYALTGLILFLSKLNPIMHCFLLIFCGDTSGSDSIYLHKLLLITAFYRSHAPAWEWSYFHPATFTTPSNARHFQYAPDHRCAATQNNRVLTLLLWRR